MTWTIDPPGLAAALQAAAASGDVVSEQFYGSAAVGGSGGVGSWGDRIELLAASAGFDGVVAGAFAGLVSDQMVSVQDALGRFGGVLQSTFDAGTAIVQGDDAIAAAILGAASRVVYAQPGEVA